MVKLWGKQPRLAHPFDPISDQKIRQVRTLRANAASCEKQLASYQDAMDRAQKRRGYVGLDGISSEAYHDVMDRAEQAMPRIRAEMAGYQKEARRIMEEELDENDLAFLSEG